MHVKVHVELVHNTRRACQGGRRGEKKRGSVSRRKRDREMSEESEGASDLLHSCTRCACNANSLHPSRPAKTEAAWREGMCSAELKGSDCHSPSAQRRAQRDSVFEMRLMLPQLKNTKLQTQVCFFRLDHQLFFFFFSPFFFFTLKWVIWKINTNTDPVIFSPPKPFSW